MKVAECRLGHPPALVGRGRANVHTRRTPPALQCLPGDRRLPGGPGGDCFVPEAPQEISAGRHSGHLHILPGRPAAAVPGKAWQARRPGQELDFVVLGLPGTRKQRSSEMACCQDSTPSQQCNGVPLGIESRRAWQATTPGPRTPGRREVRYPRRIRQDDPLLRFGGGRIPPEQGIPGKAHDLRLGARSSAPPIPRARQALASNPQTTEVGYRLGRLPNLALAPKEPGVPKRCFTCATTADTGKSCGSSLTGRSRRTTGIPGSPLSRDRGL